MHEVANHKSFLSHDALNVKDLVELRMSQMVESGEAQNEECPLQHIFTPGLYTRQIFMKAGLYITSKIHKTEHPFIISKGKVTLRTYEGNEFTDIILEAPFTGVTRPGTLRFLYIHEDCIWTTFHPNPDNETLEQIEERIIEKHENKLLSSPQNLLQ